MITNGWLDWAIRLEPSVKRVNAGISSVRGIFLHSAEGYASTLLDPNSQWGYNGNHSWHLTNLFDGKLYQHYPLSARCHHATAANQEYAGMENEGYTPNEPSLTDAQVSTIRRVVSELESAYGWRASRPTSSSDRSHTLWEHNEVVRLGGTYSTCPNGRIPWDKILSDEAPVTGKEDDMLIEWGVWDQVPSDKYRSYLLFASQEGGLTKRYVRSSEEHMALHYSMGGRHPVPLSLETLKAYVGSPEPDA